MADNKFSALYRFLDDFLDLLPQEDRDLFATYWSGLSQIGGDLLGYAFGTDLSMDSFQMPTFATERWNRYIFDPTTAVMTLETELPVLVGVTPYAFVNRAIFHSTIEVSVVSGKIQFSENTAFTSDTVTLTYPRIISGTVSVTAGGIPMIEGFDYAVNYKLGTLQRTPNTRIPLGQALVVRYQHEVYKLDLDYTIDPIANTITRVALGNIVGGDVASITYVLDKTAGPSLTSKTGSTISVDELEDFQSNFTGILPGRTLTITFPPQLAGTYPILSVLSANRIKITGAFAILTAGGVTYSVDAFPYGVNIDKKIVSIPTLQDRITDPTLNLIEGVDFLARDGLLGFRSEPPFNTLGGPSDKLPIFWAEKTIIDNQTPYRNFGVLIDFFRTNSDSYVNALRGLLYAYWTGSSDENLIRGVHILLGLPFSSRPGTVVSITETTRTVVVVGGDGVVAATKTWTFNNAAFTADDVGRKLRVGGTANPGNSGDHIISALVSPTQVITSSSVGLVDEAFGASVTLEVSGAPSVILVRTDNNVDLAFMVPIGLTTIVEVGDEVDRFQPLTNGVEIFNKNNDPGFVTTRIGVDGISKYFTKPAFTGDPATMTADEIAKALVNLEEFLFVPSVAVEAVSDTTNLVEIETFLNNLKPKWTDFVFRFSSDLTEGLTLGEDLLAGDIAVELDLTTKVVQNEQNLAETNQIFSSLIGRIELDGFLVRVLRDVTSLAAFNSGDIVEILSGPSAGTYQVLVQVTPNELRLLPEPPALDPAVSYRIFPSVLAMGHDAVNYYDQVTASGSGTVTAGVLSVPGETFLLKKVTVGMELLLTVGGVPVVGPTLDGIFEITAVTEDTITLSPAPANGAYDFQVANAYLRATAPGPVVGLPTSIAL